MEWKKKDTGHYWNPYYYECRCGSLILTLLMPCESDPWTAWLSMVEDGTLHKENFRLRHDDRTENKMLWENIEDLEQAQERAFVIMKEYMEQNVCYWDNLMSELNKMKEDS